jgi:hypothetical protein
MRWPAAWQPDALGLLDKTPINCVVIGDSERAAAGPLLERARKQNIVVVSVGAGGSSDIPSIRAAAISGINESITGDVVALSDAVWPSIPTKRSDGAESGPTGLPWVDSNGWAILLARAKAPAKSIWIDAAPPNDAPVLRSEHYVLAVADAGAYGARWIVTLEPKLAASLAAREHEALFVWKNVMQSVAFFESQKQWRTFSQVASAGVVSDFAGPNEFIATELLNLAARRQLQCRAIYKPKATPAELNGVKAIVWMDTKAPAAEWATASKDLVSKGGLLIGPASIQHFATGLAPAGAFDGRYDLYNLGTGRIAIARKPWSDPYQLAADVHLLLSRRHDVIRLWNSGSTNAIYKTGPRGQAVVQILNFATRYSGSPVSLYVPHPYKKVKWSTLPEEVPETPPVSRKQEGIEIAVPPFGSYGAIELGD